MQNVDNQYKLLQEEKVIQSWHPVGRMLQKKNKRERARCLPQHRFWCAEMECPLDSKSLSHTNTRAALLLASPTRSETQMLNRLKHSKSIWALFSSILWSKQTPQNKYQTWPLNSEDFFLVEILKCNAVNKFFFYSNIPVVWHFMRRHKQILPQIVHQRKTGETIHTSLAGWPSEFIGSFPEVFMIQR